jgi:hypothetical protein
VVVEGSLRDAGLLDDVLDRGRGVALLGEPLASDVDKELARRFRLACPKSLDGHCSHPKD